MNLADNPLCSAPGNTEHNGLSATAASESAAPASATTRQGRIRPANLREQVYTETCSSGTISSHFQSNMRSGA